MVELNEMELAAVSGGQTWEQWCESMFPDNFFGDGAQSSNACADHYIGSGQCMMTGVKG
ncbi:MAG: hypothetical protein ABIW83_06115 [Allosphingosinicella sp.]